MTKFYNILLTMVSVVATLAACTPKTGVAIPEAPLEECVYMGDRTEFSVWSPDAEDAVLKLYGTASDDSPFQTIEMDKSRDGLWKATVKEDLKDKFYTFQVKKNGKWLEETAGIAAKAVGFTHHTIVDFYAKIAKTLNNSRNAIFYLTFFVGLLKS